MHYHLTNAQFRVGGFVLILAIVFAIAAFLENRRAKTPPFLNYFGSEYDRAVLQHGSLSEAGGRLADRQTSFEDSYIRDLRAAEWRRSVSGETERNRK
jgi:hypothetical protein